MYWDLFCKVIDNWGDIGVCWRAATQLAQRGETVRLWVDDTSALAWMAPQALRAGQAGVRVHPWSAAESASGLGPLPVAEVWIEGFGCELPGAWVAARAQAVERGLARRPVWLNLEYLSAEPYVERVHGLPSPVQSGPARGWTKHFFFPGWSDATGGLLREPDLAQRQAGFDAHAWLAAHGLSASADWRISLFCYEPAALRPWLAALAQQPQRTQVLVTAGRSAAAVRAIAPDLPAGDGLQLSYLPPLTQVDFDHLLWAADFNAVRGEDSLVRALWAGKPLLWQAYVQDDDAHHAKLEAVLDALQAPPAMRHAHRIWNGAAAGPISDLLRPDDSAVWAAALQSARAALQQSPDLVTRLLDFVRAQRAVPGTDSP